MVRSKTLIPAIAIASFLAIGLPQSARADDTSFLDCDSVFSDSLCDKTSCDGDDCDGAGCLGGCGLGSCLTGLVKRSDHCFDDFISPMINFVFFEDPRTVSELRPIYVNHSIPELIGNGIPAGGDVQLYALQFRVALTERLSLIAVKDGFIIDNTGGALDTLVADGWADVTAGLKYNLFRNVETGTLGSVGFTYELPVGSTRALQAIGDGEFHFFATGGQRLLDGNAHLLSSVGYRLPVDGAVQSSAIHWSNHLDARLTDRAYIFTEVAWWHWTDDAAAGASLGVAGQDLFNLSANDVVGNDLVTQNVGFKFKPNGHIESGIAYEFPLTDFQDLIEGRVQAELILRY